MAAVTPKSYILGFKFSGKASLQLAPRKSLRSEWILFGHMPSSELLIALSLDYMVHLWGRGWSSQMNFMELCQKRITAGEFEEKQIVITVHL